MRRVSSIALLVAVVFAAQRCGWAWFEQDNGYVFLYAESEVDFGDDLTIEDYGDGKGSLTGPPNFLANESNVDSGEEDPPAPGGCGLGTEAGRDLNPGEGTNTLEDKPEPENELKSEPESIIKSEPNHIIAEEEPVITEEENPVVLKVPEASQEPPTSIEPPHPTQESSPSQSDFSRLHEAEQVRVMAKCAANRCKTWYWHFQRGKLDGMVCGDGKPYMDRCRAKCAGAKAIEPGLCPKRPASACNCNKHFDPVCVRGKSYGNLCVAGCAVGSEVPASEVKLGACPDSEKCRCELSDNAIACGDGRRYPNACQAHCFGAKSVTQGPCRCNCPRRPSPVCADGITRLNRCLARCFGSDKITPGPCPRSG